MEFISQAILGVVGLYLAMQFLRSLRLVPTRKAYVVERLGKYQKTLKPGFHALIPFVDKVAYKQDLREQTLEVEPQECFTKDNVKVIVDGVIYISVINPENASYGITNYREAAVQLAQTTTRSVIGTMDLDTTFEERAYMSNKVVEVLSEMEMVWGIKVHRYEVKNIIPPRTVQNAMERQVTAEREKRAVVARSEGVKQSVVNDAKGNVAEIVNASEAEKQRRINVAEGKAEEIRAIANATASSIERVALAISRSNGKEAVKMRIAEQYLSKISRLAKDKNQIILPVNLTNFDQIMEGVKIDESGDDD